MASLGIEVGTVLGGRYRLSERLESADEERTFVAVDEDGGRYRVLVLQPSDAVRVTRDATAAAKLSCRYVVPPVDHGVHEPTGAPYVVMPAVEGETLWNLSARLGPLQPQAVVRVGIHLARALDEAHAKGVLHGRVAPDLVIVERGQNGTATARLVSFGVSWGMDLVSASTATAAGLTAIPWTHSAAACVDDSPADAGADILALGAMLYAALAGRSPWDDADARARWESGQGEELPWLQQLAPWVEGELAQVVHATMLIDPDRRCPNAYSLIVALSALVEGDEALRWDHLTGVDEALRGRPGRSANRPSSWQDVSEPVSREPAEDVLLGATLDGRYELVHRVGSGGMGAVYEARDADGQVWAVKVIKHDLMAQGGDSVRRFLREARATQAIDSEHVVRVVEAATDSTRGLPFIVMEMLRGNDLATFVKSNGPMVPATAAWVFWRACLGLGRAHALSMVHRDVKPANIFLHEAESGAIVPKLCDFGVVKMDASLREHSATALTQTGGILGSPLYMAPEHAENAKHADARSDVWSLGISLYETLTGTRPWAECSTIGELLLALYTKEVTPLQDHAPWVPPDLAAVVHKALQRDISRRFADAGEMAAALEPFARELGDLGPESLQCVSREQRSRPAPRLDVAAISGDASVTTSPGRRRSRTRTAGLVTTAIAVLGTAAGLAYYTARTVEPPASTATQSALATPAQSVPPSVALLEIIPHTAAVTVDGTPAVIDGGTLALARGPGETAVVVVESAGVRQVASVFITTDGRPIPDRIEVPAAPASASASAGIPPRAAKPSTTRPAAEKSAGTTTTPSPTPSPSAPKFSTKW